MVSYYTYLFDKSSESWAFNMAILELALLAIAAVQFLFAIIVLGLTGHGKSIPRSRLECIADKIQLPPMAPRPPKITL